MVTTHSKRKKEKKIPDFFSNSPENNFQVVFFLGVLKFRLLLSELPEILKLSGTV